MCILSGHGKGYAKFGEIWTRNMFNIYDSWRNSQTVVCSSQWESGMRAQLNMCSTSSNNTQQ